MGGKESADLQLGCSHRSRAQCPVSVQDAQGGEDVTVTLSLPRVPGGHREGGKNIVPGRQGARLALPANGVTNLLLRLYTMLPL